MGGSQQRVVRLARVVELGAWWFAALGLTLPFVYGRGPFALYAERVVAWAGGDGDPALRGLLLGILGGSIAGKWVLHAALARGPLRRGERWAHRASVVGLLGWFVVDSGASLALGASFNVWMINLAPLAFVGLPLAISWRWFDAPEPAPPARSPSLRRARAIALGAFALVGLGGLAAAAGDTPLTRAWLRALDQPWAVAPIAPRFTSFFLGPIGGCIAAQAAMMVLALARRPDERWVVVAGAASVLVWFVVDSGFGLATGGTVNVLALNVPSLVVLLGPLALLRRAQSSPAARSSRGA